MDKINRKKQDGNAQAAGAVAVLIFILGIIGYNVWKNAAVTLAEETLNRTEVFNKNKGRLLENKKMLLITRYYTELKRYISSEDWPNPYMINLLTEQLNRLIDEAEISVSKKLRSKAPVIKYKSKCDCSQSRWNMDEECRLACGKSVWE